MSWKFRIGGTKEQTHSQPPFTYSGPTFRHPLVTCSRCSNRVSKKLDPISIEM